MMYVVLLMFKHIFQAVLETTGPVLAENTLAKVVKCAPILCYAILCCAMQCCDAL